MWKSPETTADYVLLTIMFVSLGVAALLTFVKWRMQGADDKYNKKADNCE